MFKNIEKIKKYIYNLSIMNDKKSIKSLTYEKLEKEILELGYKKYRAKQIYEWLYRKNVVSFEEMTNLSKDIISKLNEIYYIENFNVLSVLESKDGTKKYLFELTSNDAIETVLMKYNHGYTVCISSQKGCRMGCKFCASTKAKFQGNLEVSEIVEQILKVERIEKIRVSNIVFMGIGEPLDNFDNVVDALQIINDPFAINIGARHISISTSGIVPKIYELADRKLQTTLSVSLHYTTDELRSKQMPVNRAYNIRELLKACRYYIEKTNRRISFEYAMIDGENDSIEDAKRLIELVKGMKCHINLIPINQIDEIKFKESEISNILKFRDYLNEHGIVATIRRRLGEDINAACGQLRKQKLESLEG